MKKLLSLCTFARPRLRSSGSGQMRLKAPDPAPVAATRKAPDRAACLLSLRPRAHVRGAGRVLRTQ